MGKNRWGAAAIGSMVLAALAWGAERRAAPPKFAPNQFDGVFYNDVRQAISGTRPQVRELQGAAPSNPGASAGPSGNTASVAPAAAAGGDATGGWGALIRPASVEDEIKRVKLRYDEIISTPAAFKSGGFSDARRDLSVLAMFFGVIAQHPGQVRWKDNAAAARDLMSRTAANCKAGSAQVFNEAKLRKQDLQDLLSGTGLSSRDAVEDPEWGSIVDRVPLMQYLEEVVSERLDALVANDNALTSDAEEIIRLAEAVAVVSEVMVGAGMDDATDADYQGLTQRMKSAALAARDAVGRKDTAAFRTAVGAMGQSCDACHEQYR